jgi:hypothetical protein
MGTDRGLPYYQVFMLLDLNPVMSIIANVPAAIASTVRAVQPTLVSLLMF